MTVTIDRAGRLVVPKKIRERYHMTPGTELTLEDDGEGISIRPEKREGSLVRDHRGLLVFQGSGEASKINITEFIKAQREERNLAIIASFSKEA